MISWTSSGLVRTPSTVQIRCNLDTPRELKAGAPSPGRSLSNPELRENLQYFRFGLDTPRTIPCTAVTLSGLNGDDAERLEILKTFPLEYITLHVNPASVNWDELRYYQNDFQRISIPLNSDLQNLQIPSWAVAKTTLVIPLEEGLADWLPTIIEKANRENWNAFIFLYPFPLNRLSSPLSPSMAIELLERLTQSCLKTPVIKGLPYCLAKTKFSLFAKTSNRWYVDADHQKEQALLFFPDISCYYKDDQCRFCRHNEECDGFFLEYLRLYNLQLRVIT